MRTLKILLLIVLVGYLGLIAALVAFQRSLMYQTQPRRVTAAQSTMSLPVDGAQLVITAKQHDGDKAIIYFGGNADDVSVNLPAYAKAFPDCALYFMHYRGYGGSTGRPSEAAIVADAAVLYQRVRAAHSDIAIVGRSLGTGVAIQLASHVDASHLILITPYDSLGDVVGKEYWYIPFGRLLLLDRWMSGRFAPMIRIPTVIFEAANDEIIPHDSTEQLWHRFPSGVASLTLLKGVGHNDFDDAPAFLEVMTTALNRSR